MLRTLTVHSLLGILAAVLVFTLTCPEAQAHTHHSANICSATASDICAHIGYDEINTTDEAKFMLDFKPKAIDPALVTNISVELKMDMGGGSSHGSSPVTLTQLDAAHVEVTKAFFPMAGVWEIHVGFEYNSGKHEIVIPLEVK